MVDPIIAATAISAGASLIGGLFGGNGSSESGMTLPPAQEAAMLRDATKNLELLRNNISQVDKLIANYNDRINLITKGIEGTIPDAELTQQITQNSAQIALGLGADAQQLIEDGFLDAEDIARIEELDQLNNQEFVDEQFEQEFSNQRAALEQQLMRDGRSLAEISQTLMQFDSQKAVERQQRGETLRQGAFNRGLATLQAQSGLRQQGFQNVLSSFQAGQQQQQQTLQGFANLANLAQAQNQTNMDANIQQTNLIGAQQSLYNQLGQFKFSGQAQQSRLGQLGISEKDVARSAANMTVGLPVASAKAGVKAVGKVFKKLF